MYLRWKPRTFAPAMSNPILFLFRVIYLSPGKRNDRQIDSAFTMISALVAAPLFTAAYPALLRMQAAGQENLALGAALAVIIGVFFGVSQFKKQVIKRLLWNDAFDFGERNTPIKLVIALGLLGLLIASCLPIISHWNGVIGTP